LLLWCSGSHLISATPKQQPLLNERINSTSPAPASRAAGADKAIILKPPRQLTLEYIEDDELVEVTPNPIRLRKTYLKEAERKRQARQAQ
jgi:predicted membrane GTPase involved in stress response